MSSALSQMEDMKAFGRCRTHADDDEDDDADDGKEMMTWRAVRM